MNFYPVNILLGVLLIFSCNSKTQTKDEDYFYSDIGGLSIKRIPLIKPYEVKKVTENEWRLELQTTRLLELSIHNIKAVNVIDSAIIVHAKGEVSIKGVRYKESWFVIIPSSEIEEGFSSETEFFSYLRKAEVKFSNFHNVEDVYKIFNKNRKINWKDMR